jgi:hypothetical protein
MRKTASKSKPVFRFAPRWKEELVVTGPGGSFILELPMGVLTACLPTREAWNRQAPAWALDLWPTLKAELEAWCAANNATLEIDETAQVWPYAEQRSVGGGRWLWGALGLGLLAVLACWRLTS